MFVQNPAQADHRRARLLTPRGSVATHRKGGGAPSSAETGLTEVAMLEQEQAIGRANADLWCKQNLPDGRVPPGHGSCRLRAAAPARSRAADPQQPCDVCGVLGGWTRGFLGPGRLCSHECVRRARATAEATPSGGGGAEPQQQPPPTAPPPPTVPVPPPPPCQTAWSATRTTFVATREIQQEGCIS